VTDEHIDRLELEGGTLRVLSAGEGPDLVYLHGVGDSGGFLPVLSELATVYRVTRPDHAGFLESDDFGIRSVADIAAVHERMLDRLGIERLTLVGCSLGGWVATELALRVPDRIERLVLIDAAGLAGDGSAPDIFTLAPDAALEATVFDEGRRAAARASTPDPAIAARLARSRATAEAIASDPYMHDPSLAERAGALAAAGFPVHLVWGADDGIVPVAYLESWRAVFPEAAVTVIPRAGHLPHVEQADAFLEATRLLDVPTASGAGATWS
jgi:pimeloyl-ACP methyl ester carboxylesterase